MAGLQRALGGECEVREALVQLDVMRERADDRPAEAAGGAVLLDLCKGVQEV